MFTSKKDKKIEELTQDNANLRALIQSKQSKINSLKGDLEKKEKINYYVNLCKNLDVDNLPKSYLPEDTNKKKAFLGELSSLVNNKYLNKVIDYTINLVASYSLKQDMDYSIPRAKYVIEGIISIREQLKSAEEQLQKIIESEKPITEEENEDLIKTSIEEVLNK